MADKLTEALSLFVEVCTCVVSTHDLVTKVRIDLTNDYALEIYLRETTAQYSYAVLRAGRRVLGWDNAHTTLACRMRHTTCTAKTAVLKVRPSPAIPPKTFKSWLAR